MSSFKCSLSGPNISHLFFADDSLLFSNVTDIDFFTIRQILDDYAEASGQVINFEKSTVCLSKTMRHVDGRHCSNIIGVKLVRCHERYLGLPSISSRNKWQLFRDIKDRVWAKIKGWRSKTLLVGGKKILFRAMV